MDYGFIVDPGCASEGAIGSLETGFRDQASWYSNQNL